MSVMIPTWIGGDLVAVESWKRMSAPAAQGGVGVRALWK